MKPDLWWKPVLRAVVLVTCNPCVYTIWTFFCIYYAYSSVMRAVPRAFKITAFYCISVCKFPDIHAAILAGLHIPYLYVYHLVLTGIYFGLNGWRIISKHLALAAPREMAPVWHTYVARSLAGQMVWQLTSKNSVFGGVMLILIGITERISSLNCSSFNESIWFYDDFLIFETFIWHFKS